MQFWKTYLRFLNLQIQLMFLWIYPPFFIALGGLLLVSTSFYVLCQPEKWKIWLCSDITRYVGIYSFPFAFFYIFNSLYPRKKTCAVYQECYYEPNSLITQNICIITIILFIVLSLLFYNFPKLFRRKFKDIIYIKLRKSTDYIFKMFLFPYFVFIFCFIRSYLSRYCDLCIYLYALSIFYILVFSIIIVAIYLNELCSCKNKKQSGIYVFIMCASLFLKIFSFAFILIFMYVFNMYY